MAIQKFYKKRATPGWKFDRAKGLYWSWGYSIWMNGRGSKRVRDHGFATQSDAEAAVARLRLAQKEQQYGFLPRAVVPQLSNLIERHLASIPKKREHTRSKRVLHGWLELLPAGIKVTDVDTPAIDLYVDKRIADGVGSSSIDRELNIISATLHSVDIHYPGEAYKQLRQWRPPRIPRPVYSKKPRKRVVYDDEREKLVNHLLAPQREDEQPQEALARNRVGQKVRFVFLVGCRHSEMLRIKKNGHVDWRRRALKIVGSKTDKDRVVDPLPDTAFAILEEAAAQSRTEYVFGSPNIRTKTYKILKKACEACEIPYGRGVADGIVMHDARHTVTTVMGQEGVEPATIQEQMGWSDKEFLLYYSHSTPTSKRFAAGVMERVAGSRDNGVDKKPAEEIEGLH